jgi:hypothetical protein
VEGSKEEWSIGGQSLLAMLYETPPRSYFGFASRYFVLGVTYE